MVAGTFYLTLVPAGTAANLNEVKKLIATDAVPYDSFGEDVAIGGKRIMAGAPAITLMGSAAYVFEDSDSGAWTKATKFTPDDPSKYSLFGTSVAISGNIAICGDTSDDLYEYGTGAAYIHQFDSKTGWQKIDKLSPLPASTWQYFGNAVAVEGNTAIVAAYADPSAGTLYSGAAYVYRAAADGSWHEITKLTAPLPEGADGIQFAHSVDLSGDTAIFGAPFTNAAYIFQESESGVWSQTARLTIDDFNYFRFGAAVAIDEDIAVVGGWSESVYVFQRDSQGEWRQSAVLALSNSTPEDDFGFSVDADEGRIVVGARRYGDTPGSAHVFERDALGIWHETYVLTASDGKLRSEFGYSVAISGALVVVGAPSEGSNIGGGAAYVFQIPEPSIGVVIIAGSLLIGCSWHRRFPIADRGNSC